MDDDKLYQLLVATQARQDYTDKLIEDIAKDVSELKKVVIVGNGEEALRSRMRRVEQKLDELLDQRETSKTWWQARKDRIFDALLILGATALAVYLFPVLQELSL